ncbi:hypothetical protein F5X71_00085 [Nocardia brasiliensis]|uniref:Uncharacterized protein n=1 Tax=Nocardia brasiliensis TaxID=37326 RepID=A0A6G9XJ52_NOCBR|nr:hypothetical protein [Nocardia brasiliensis]QIS00938.1 hypothetical protein F5X71_00085 [Nocardia brasiliensis]
MTIHYFDETDAFDRDERDAVICLQSVRQLVDDNSVLAWDEHSAGWAA